MQCWGGFDYSEFAKLRETAEKEITNIRYIAKVFRDIYDHDKAKELSFKEVAEMANHLARMVLDLADAQEIAFDVIDFMTGDKSGTT